MKKQKKSVGSVKTPRIPLTREAIPPVQKIDGTGFGKGDTWDDDLLCFSSACERHKINPNKDRFYTPEIAVLYGRKPNTVYYWFVRQRGPVKMYKDRRGNVFAFRHDLARDLQDVVAAG